MSFNVYHAKIFDKEGEITLSKYFKTKGLAKKWIKRMLKEIGEDDIDVIDDYCDDYEVETIEVKEMV